MNARILIQSGFQLRSGMSRQVVQEDMNLLASGGVSRCGFNPFSHHSSPHSGARRTHPRSV